MYYRSGACYHLDWTLIGSDVPSHLEIKSVKKILKERAFLARQPFPLLQFPRLMVPLIAGDRPPCSYPFICTLIPTLIYDPPTPLQLNPLWLAFISTLLPSYLHSPVFFYRSLTSLINYIHSH